MEETRPPCYKPHRERLKYRTLAVARETVRTNDRIKNERLPLPPYPLVVTSNRSVLFALPLLFSSLFGTDSSGCRIRNENLNYDILWTVLDIFDAKDLLLLREVSRETKAFLDSRHDLWEVRECRLVEYLPMRRDVRISRHSRRRRGDNYSSGAIITCTNVSKHLAIQHKLECNRIERSKRRKVYNSSGWARRNI